MGARNRAHEQDDRHHRQAGRDDRRREADLSLGVEDPASGRRQQKEKCAEHLGEQPPVREPRILELVPGAELESQEMERAGAIVIAQTRRR